MSQAMFGEEESMDVEASFNFISPAQFEALLLQRNIRKWRSLEIDVIYRVLGIREIPIKDATASGVFAELLNQKRERFDVWITPIIHEELMKYNVYENIVYIKPSGTKVSNSTGQEYYDFKIVVNNI